MDRLRGAYPDSARDTGSGTGPDSGSSGGDEAINGPVVFSCAKCRTIVGDTFAYAASAPERNLFGLHAVPASVECGKARKMSATRGEEGSVYHELACAECGAVVGRRYVTTTQDMDALRNTFAIDIERVITYELGRCIAGRPQPPSDGPPPEFYTSLAFREEMDLVKSNVNAMAARMQRIEQAVASQTVASPRASSSGARKRSSQGLNTDIYRDGAQRPFDR